MATRSMNYLRKNAKVVIVVMGVILMITFVVGDALYNMVGRERVADQDPVAVTWTNGRVRESDLQRMRSRQQVAVAFLQRTIEKCLAEGGSPVIGGQQLRPGDPIHSVGISMDYSDEGLVRTMLLAEEARRLGIVVDNAAVIAFLRQISGPELREGDWNQIAIELIGPSGYMTVNQLFEQLAYELQAQHVQTLALASLYSPHASLGVFGPVMPPGQAWDYFNRLNRRVTIEAFPIDAEPFINQVKDEPMDAELRKLFDSGRGRDPNPNLAEPGFHRPHRIAFSWLKVDFEPFLEQAKEQITEEQIAERYEQDISQGRHKVLDLPEEQPAEPPTDPSDPTVTPPVDPGATPPADSPEPPLPQQPGDTPSEPAPPASEPIGPTEQPEGEAQDDELADQADEVEQPAAAPAEAQPALQEPATAAPPATETPAAVTPAETPAEAPAGTDPATDPLLPESPPKFKPLEKVREDIRNELAQPIAQEARDAAVKAAMDEINDYGRRLRRWQSLRDSQIKTSASDPGPLDLQAIADRHGFEMGETPLVDRYEVAEYEIGQKVSEFDMAALQFLRQFRMLSFAEMAFGEDEPLYRPQQANSSDPDVMFIYFRTDRQPAGDQTFAEAKEQVQEAWKRQKAFEMAMAEAQKLADKAKQAPSLRDVAPDPASIIEPQPFSWLTTGSLAMGFGEPQLSQVPEIDLAGREFMQAVFALKPGQVGVAPNQPHTKVYTVRIVEQQPSEEILRDQFLESGMNFQILAVAQRDIQETAYDWMRSLEEQYQVTWQRQPRDGRTGS